MPEKFLTDHLRMWKDEGIPAPLNEIQSIQSWLRYLGEHGADGTKDAMRKRMILLAQAASELHKEGPEAEAAAGIYDNRPDMKP